MMLGDERGVSVEEHQTHIGKHIKDRREAAGMTQQDLAVKAGLSVSNLSQIEQGKKEDPRISTVSALARTLGVTVDQLLTPAAAPAAEPSPAKKGRRKKRE